MKSSSHMSLVGFVGACGTMIVVTHGNDVNV